MDTHPELKKRTAGNEDTGLLKWIALVFMIIDHVGYVFFPLQMEWRLLGRIAFPLYAWCMVVGVCYTRSYEKYALRLLAVCAVSQPCYMLCFHVPWYDFNIYLTLLLGLTALWGIRAKRRGSHIWAPILCLLIPLIIETDYGWRGVALILLLYAVRNSKAAIAAVLAAFCCYWGEGTLLLRTVFGIAVPQHLDLLPQADLLLRTVGRVQFYAVLALPLILWQKEDRTKMSKLIGYSVYPAHLLAIGLLRMALK